MQPSAVVASVSVTPFLRLIHGMLLALAVLALFLSCSSASPPGSSWVELTLKNLGNYTIFLTGLELSVGTTTCLQTNVSYKLKPGESLSEVQLGCSGMINVKNNSTPPSYVSESHGTNVSLAVGKDSPSDVKLNVKLVRTCNTNKAGSDCPEFICSILYPSNTWSCITDNLVIDVSLESSEEPKGHSPVPSNSPSKTVIDPLLYICGLAFVAYLLGVA